MFWKKDDVTHSQIMEKLGSISQGQTDMRQDIAEIKKRQEADHEILKKHEANSLANAKRLNLEIEARKELEERVAQVEAPQRFLKNLGAVIRWTGWIAGSILASAGAWKIITMAGVMK